MIICEFCHNLGKYHLSCKMDADVEFGFSDPKKSKNHILNDKKWFLKVDIFVIKVDTYIALVLLVQFSGPDLSRNHTFQHQKNFFQVAYNTGGGTEIKKRSNEINLDYINFLGLGITFSG